MKKWIYLLVAMILCLAGSAFAENEDFQLRNGIVFGDTVDIVKQKETLTITDEIDGIIQYSGTIAGLEGILEFCFDEDNGALTDMVYTFDSVNSRDIVNINYSTLRNSLLRKYGTPLGNTGGDLYLITGKAIESSAFMIGMYIYILDGDGDYIDYDEWVIDCKDYNVKIDLISTYVRDKEYNYTYRIYLSYHYYTDADYSDKVQKKQEENAVIDSDL